jgi:hypothetical protein
VLPTKGAQHMQVNALISDLFFNLDHSSNKVVDNKGRFVDFDKDKLKDKAEWFLCALSDLNVFTPKTEELVEDFLKRV